MPLNVSGICARIWFSCAPDTTITSARSQSAPKCPSCSGSIRVLLGVRVSSRSKKKYRSILRDLRFPIARGCIHIVGYSALRCRGESERECLALRLRGAARKPRFELLYLRGAREREAPALPRSAQKCRPSDIGLLKHFGFGLIVSDCLLERIECHVHEINRAHIDAVELAVVLSGDTKERRIDLTRERYDAMSHDRRPHEVGNIAAGDACAPEILGSTL